jgi:GTP-binding protein
MLAELDTQIQQFGGTKFTMQAIITRADQLGDSSREHVDQMKTAIFKAAPTCLPPIITACSPNGSKFGIELVRKSITDCCGL